VARLAANTSVKVVSQTELWTAIELPGGKIGYVQNTYLRPTTADEAANIETATATQTANRRTQSLATGAPLPVEVGLRRGSSLGRPRRNTPLAITLVGLSLTLCIIGSILASIEEQQCVISGFGGESCQIISHPYAGIGGGIDAVGLLLLIVGIILGVAALIRRS